MNIELIPFDWLQFNKNLKILLHPPPCALDAVMHLYNQAFKTANNPAITAKRATPSTKAAVRIMFARMSLDASG